MGGAYSYGAQSRRLMGASYMEFIGTMFFTLTVSIAMNTYDTVMAFAALVTGMVVAVLTFTGLGISGGHFNPAITLGVAIDDPDFGWMRMVCYLIAQFVGACIGGLIAADIITNSDKDFPRVSPTFTQPRALLLETIFSFLLVFTVLRAVHKRDMYGFLVGVVVFVGMAVSYDKSGGSFNPAVALGLYVGAAAVGKIDYDDIWIYFLGAFLGAALASLFNSLILFLQGGHGQSYDYTTEEETDRETYGNQKPTYGNQKPSYGNERPSYGNERPSYGNERPSYGNEQPTYTTPQQPTYETPQTYGGEIPQPSYGNERPSYGNAQPEVIPVQPSYVGNIQMY